jgi:flagella basal body P-ring formation protein FlgA
VIVLYAACDLQTLSVTTDGANLLSTLSLIFIKHRTKMMNATNFLLIFSYFIIINPAYAVKTIDHRALQANVEQFVLAKVMAQVNKNQDIDVNVSVRKIDPRLNLRQCDVPLAFELKGQTIKRNNSVKVSCTSAISPWSIYTMSTISEEMNVITAGTELPRHHIITAKDLISLKQDVNRLRGGYTTQKLDLIGQQLIRPIRAGTVIYQNQLQLPVIIKKGDKVIIVTTRGALSVIHQGTALQNASKGERVQVKNHGSNRTIQGFALSIGRVEIL